MTAAELAGAALLASAVFVGGRRRGTLERAALRRRGLRWSGRSGRADPLGLPGRPVPPPTDDQVVALAEQVAGLLEAGLPPHRAWRAVAAHAVEEPVRVLAAGTVTGLARGLGPAAAVRRQLEREAAGGRPWRIRWAAPRAGPPGHAGVVRLAVVLEVSERSGAGAARGLRRLADGLRDDVAARRERENALAGPRATAGLLGLLPLGGPALGLLVGADPVGVLVGTVPGRVALVVGVALWWAGRSWSAALVRRAEAGR